MSENAPPGVQHEHWCKNRLQEYTQRLSMQLPVYQTYQDGVSHVQRFKSRVWVNGVCYTSPNSFPHRKSAEQDVAKIAIVGLLQKAREEACSLVLKEIIFSKSILNEYANKMNLKLPTYETVQPEGPLPAFVSSLVLNGVTYTGDMGRSKKEAEHLAARSAILSILGSDTGITMCEVVRSKFKLYSAFNNVENCPNNLDGSVPVGVNSSGGLNVSLNKRKEVVGTDGVVNSTMAALPEPSPAQIPLIEPTFQESPLEQALSVLSAHMPPDESKKRKSEASEVDLPNIIVPPELQNSQPTSGTKRKKKKKAKKQMQTDNQLPADAISQAQVPACGVAQ